METRSQCNAVVYLRVSKGLKCVQCLYSHGHKADGSHGFAFHTGKYRSTLVVWKDGQAIVERQ